MADRKNAYTAITAPTHSIGSLATSSTLVAGQEANAIDNGTTKYLDIEIYRPVTTGTTPTAGTIELWLIPSFDGTTWPDVFDGTDSAETVTSRDILRACGRLAASTPTDTTSNRTYPLHVPSVRDIFGTVPQKVGQFLTHSTGVNLNSTAGTPIINGTYETF